MCQVFIQAEVIVTENEICVCVIKLIFTADCRVERKLCRKFLILLILMFVLPREENRRCKINDCEYTSGICYLGDKPHSPNHSDLAECVILCTSWLPSPGKVYCQTGNIWVTLVELRGPIRSAQAGHQLSIYCIKELFGRNSPHLASVNSAYKI